MAAKPIIVVGGQDWGVPEDYPDTYHEYSQQKFDSAGNAYPHGFYTRFEFRHRGIYGIAVDASGQCYLGSRFNISYEPSAGVPHPYTLRKLTHDGDLVWGVNQKSPVHNLTLDSSGNLYIVNDAVNAAGQLWAETWANFQNPGSRTGYYTTRKYSSAGELLWAADHGMGYGVSGIRMPIAVRNGYVYTGGKWNATTGNLIKYNATTGAVVWGTEKEAFSEVYGIAVDAADNVYIGGSLSGYALKKYNSAGELVASLAATEYAGVHIQEDSDGNWIVYTPPSEISPGVYTPILRKYNSAFSLLAVNPNTAWALNAQGMMLDADNRVYLCRKRPSDSFGATPATLYQFAADFSDGWAVPTLAQDTLDTIDAYCLAVREVEPPGLRIPLAVSVPTWVGDYYTHAPGLAVAMQCGIPRLIRDYAGIALPIRYRLILTGSPDLELPMQYFQCRRTAAGLRLSVNGPLPDSSTLAVMAASTGDLVVRRGVRLTDGTELLDELLRTPLARIRYDAGSGSASITLEGETALTESSGAERTLIGISYRNEQDGRRRVRCMVDTWLRIGDTVQLGGGETMIAAEIVYSVAPDQALMEVAESDG